MRTWFYAHHGGDPYFNMAFDEAMLAACQSDPDITLVRLYSWRPGAMSIGANQKQENALDWSRLGDTPVVRRITGGRALYHDESELTYSVALNLSGASWSNQTGARAVYQRVAETLSSFLNQLGVEAEVQRRSSSKFARSSYPVVPPCFASAARYELMSGENKVAASAQRQIGTAILQHGSIKPTGTVSHPALAGIAGPAQLQPVDRKEFEVYARRFVRVWESRWPGAVTPVKMADLKGLEEREEWVRREPLARRDTFEQSAAPKGL